MKQFYILLLSIGFLAITVNAQVTISGTVTELETGEPLTGVNVYLSGTTIGASTDQNGEFSFSTDLIGKQDIVASFIGFKTIVRSVEIGKVSTFKQDFSLQPEVLELEEIRVVASNDIFLRRLDLFKTFFIGFDSNADQTYIMNPEVLNFDEDMNRNRISVTANAPLIIHNNALGYRYEVELREVYFDTKENTGLYKVYPRIIEMEPRNRRTQRRWNSNRKDSFEGSSRHFFKSLTENRLRRNDFRVYPSDRVLVNYSDSLNLIKRWYPSNWEYISENFSVFRLNADAIRIEYIDDSGSNTNQVISAPEVSSLDIRGFPEIIIINKNGLLLNSVQVALYGQWSDTRFSNFLPLDYSN
jgi:hypothetical protein